LRQTTARVGQLRVLAQASMVIRSAFSNSRSVGGDQARTVVGEDAPAIPGRVGLDDRAGDVTDPLDRIGGAVLRLGRRAGGVPSFRW